MEVVSIIVPIYNAERFLHRSLASILTQTYRPIEIILINDGSTDRSGEICDEYAMTYDFIKVIHQNNKGPARARYAGIQRAVGSYIQFVDADDVIKPTMTASLVQAMKTNVGLVICSYETDVAKYQPAVTGRLPYEVFLQHLGNLYYDIIFPSLCNKLYRLDLIKENAVNFSYDSTFGEDVMFNFNYLKAKTDIYVLADVLYEYKRNNQSLTNRYIENMYFHYKKIFLRMKTILKDNDCYTGNNKLYYKRIVANGLVHSLSNLFHQTSNLSKGERISHFRKITEDTFFISHIPTLQHTLQEKILRRLILTTKRGTFLFLHIKEWIREHIKPFFQLCKKLNRIGF